MRTESKSWPPSLPLRMEFHTIINHIVTTYASLPLRVFLLRQRRKTAKRGVFFRGWLACLRLGNTLEKLFSFISAHSSVVVVGRKERKNFDLNFCFAKRSFIPFDELKHDKSDSSSPPAQKYPECIVILNLSTWTRLSLHFHLMPFPSMLLYLALCSSLLCFQTNWIHSV